MIEMYNTKIIQYKDKVEIVKYQNIRVRGNPLLSSAHSSQVDNSKKAIEERAFQQMYRIKRRVKYYMLSNNFDLFWTLTFNDEKVDATNYKKVKKTLMAWLKYQREKHGKFGYLFIPEFHKSGRIHFHGVTQDFAPPLIVARSPKNNRLIKKNGIQIFNANNWKKGFSTVSQIANEEKTASYLTKYITKEVMQIPTEFNEPRYLVSRGLQNPKIEYTLDEKNKFKNFVPSFVSGEVSLTTNDFEPKVTIYNLEIQSDKYIQKNSPKTYYKINDTRDSYLKK